MHKMVLTVFKLLGLSLMLMFLLDTTLVVVETLTVHSRITNLAGIMQNEIARNNCVPEALRTTVFTNSLKEVQDKSGGIMIGYETNMETSKTYNGVTYDSLSEENAKDYGALTSLYIRVTLEPTKIYFNVGDGGSKPNSQGSLLSKVSYKYDLVYVYTVPCLRYLK